MYPVFFINQFILVRPEWADWWKKRIQKISWDCPFKVSQIILMNDRFISMKNVGEWRQSRVDVEKEDKAIESRRGKTKPGRCGEGRQSRGDLSGIQIFYSFINRQDPDPAFKFWFAGFGSSQNWTGSAITGMLMFVINQIRILLNVDPDIYPAFYVPGMWLRQV